MFKLSIRRGLFSLFIIISTLSILSISAIWIYSEVTRNDNHLKEINENMMEEHKTLIKNEVERVISHIEFKLKNSDIPQDEIQDEILKWVATIHFDYGGYVFVNTYDGNALVFDGKKIDGIKDVSNMIDVDGFRLFDEEKRLYETENGGYIYYKFKKMNSDIPELKISFITGFKKWEWIIGAGVYLSDIEIELSKLESQHNDILKRKIFIIAIIFIFFSVLLYVGSKILARYINKEFEVFTSFFRISARKNRIIETDKLNIFEFKELANTANKMIRDREKMSKKLSTKEEQYRTLVDGSLAGIYITQNYIIKFCNQKFANIFGYNLPDEIIGKHTKELIDEKYFNKVKLEIDERENGEKKDSRYEVKGVKKNGDIIDIEIIGGKITYNGKVAIQGTLLDVSKRNEALRELIKSQQQFLEFMEHLPALVVIKDENLRYLFLNKFMKELVGGNDSWIGKTTMDVFPEEYAKKAGRFDNEAIKNGFVEHQEKISLKNGSGNFNTYRFRINLSDDKFLIGLIALDITKQKKAEDDLNKYKESLEMLVKERTEKLNKKTISLEKSTITLKKLIEEMRLVQNNLKISNTKLHASNTELEAFSYSVSHDLRTPLRSIENFSIILNNEHTDAMNKEGKDMISRIIQSSRNMKLLITDLLRLSRIGIKELDIEKVDVTKLSNNIINDLQKNNPERKIEVSVSKNMHIMADYHMLSIMMKNLLENAWKFTLKTANPKIEIGINSNEKMNSDGRINKIVIYIKDNGVGFNNKYSTKIFTAFNRMHTDKEFSGTGIGLATVMRIVNRHGGMIKAESEINKGSTFYFYL